MPISNKRAMLASLLAGGGILGLIERFARRDVLLVLNYHRIGDAAASPFYRPIYSATPEDFAAQMRALRNAYRVLGPDEFHALLDGSGPNRGPCALVTFDDAYRDQAQGFEILESLGLSGLLFVPTDYIDHPRPPWWDFVAYGMRQAPRRRFALEIPRPLEIDRDRESDDDAAWRIIEGLLADASWDEGAFRDHFRQQSGLSETDGQLGRDMFLSWEELGAWVRRGIGIGSHTHTHPNLGRLSEDRQREELASSRARLEERLGVPIRTLAYPFGTGDSYSAATQQLARESGYESAFAFAGGANRLDAIDRFAIKRFGVGHADTPAMVRGRAALLARRGRSFL